MTVNETIERLQELPSEVSVVIFNPCTGETLDLEVLRLQNGMVQMLFDERPKTGNPFAPLWL
jgi:hypothetical protein